MHLSSLCGAGTPTKYCQRMTQVPFLPSRGADPGGGQACTQVPVTQAGGVPHITYTYAELSGSAGPAYASARAVGTC